MFKNISSIINCKCAYIWYNSITCINLYKTKKRGTRHKSAYNKIFFQKPKKREANGSHCSPGRQLPSINIDKAMNIITGPLTRRFFFENLMDIYLSKLEHLSLKDALCQVWLNTTMWFCRRF